MSRVITEFAQFFDSEGDPIENGFLEFYESGSTTTRKDTYADASHTIANMNPVQLDAGGRAPNIFGTGAYRVILWELNPVTGLPGSQVAVYDPVNSEQYYASAGGNFEYWSNSVTFELGSIAIYENSYYRSIIAGNLGNIPSTTPTAWEQIEFIRHWNPNVIYGADAIVIHDAVLYWSLLNNNLNNTPSSSPTYWESMFGSGGAQVPDNVEINFGLSSNYEASGIKTTVTVDANSTGIGALLYCASDGNYEEADADAAATMPVTALALETGTGSKQVLLSGAIRNDSWSLTPGGLVYASETTGAITQTAPSGTGDIVQVIGYAVSAIILYFNPSNDMAEVA